jgi:uncharacterized protein YcfJ
MKVLTVIATALALVAGTASAETRYARIIRVEPNYHTVQSSVVETRCENVQVPIYGQAQGDAAAGALLGMIIGGAIGDAVSNGDGGATAGGAVIGGLIGADRAQNGSRQAVTGYRTERQCRDVVVQNPVRQIRNYTITYQWSNIVAQSYTYNQYQVGDQIPVTVTVVAQ